MYETLIEDLDEMSSDQYDNWFERISKAGFSVPMWRKPMGLRRGCIEVRNLKPNHPKNKGVPLAVGYVNSDGFQLTHTDVPALNNYHSDLKEIYMRMQ